MGKSVHDSVLDQSLTYVKNNSTRLCVCSTEPTTYTEAITTYKLADKSITSADFGAATSGDSSSGRKIQVNAQSAVSIDTTGSAQHVALVKVASTMLVYVTTTASTSLTLGGTVNVGAWDIQFNDPT